MPSAELSRRVGKVVGYCTAGRYQEADNGSELVGMDCFYIGRLRKTEGAVWQLSAIDIASSYGWAELVVCKQGNPTGQQVSKLARRVADDLKAAGWRLERVLCDNGQEFKSERFGDTLGRLGARRTHIRAGRPQINGHVEALHKTILDECWRPAFARYLQPRLSGLRRDLETYLSHYNFERVHLGRLTRGRVPADIVYGARKMEAR
jgi:Integrase core domain